ncbi:MAG: hypothetical protein QW210_01120 [Candidatus Woesearchaeota archaeon]
MDEKELSKIVVAISNLYNDTNNNLYKYNELFFDTFFEHFREYYREFIENYKSITDALEMMNEDYKNLMFNSVKIFPEYRHMFESTKNFQNLKSLYNSNSLEELIINNPLEDVVVFFRDELNFKENFDIENKHKVMDILYSFLSDFEVVYYRILKTEKWINHLTSNGTYISRKYLDISSFFGEWLYEVYSFDKKISEKLKQYEENSLTYFEDKSEYLKLWLRNYLLANVDNYKDLFLSKKENIITKK